MSYHVAGPVTAYWNATGGTATGSLGIAKGGFTIHGRTGVNPVTDDDHGQAPGTYIFTGKSCTVEFIGMDASSIKAAAPFPDGASLELGSAVGSLASEAGKILTILERNTSNAWVSSTAAPVGLGDVVLSSTQELNFPNGFLLVPSATGKFWTTIPSYIKGT